MNTHLGISVVKSFKKKKVNTQYIKRNQREKLTANLKCNEKLMLKKKLRYFQINKNCRNWLELQSSSSKENTKRQE